MDLAATHKFNTQGTRSEEESVPRQDKNAGSVFEQRNALARLRAHLRDEVRNRAGRACHGWRLLRLSDLTVFSAKARAHSGQAFNKNGEFLNSPFFSSLFHCTTQSGAQLHRFLIEIAGRNQIQLELFQHRFQTGMEIP
ncbi:hypothetical protein PagCFBP13532_16655 [Pantoea agglomerans]|nr:hypothetical protein PagCFBP13505_10075 [Pantoea agglomerans]TKK20975.1 hypothetical protein PagCFBP13516_08065 [Pantoea agglomerans]TKK31238.1 hypothetical protein PagCFBP13532_16655 [Pantoea agglomerans]